MERKKINKTPDRPDQPIGAQERNYYGFSFRVRNVGINLNLKKLITLYQQWQKKTHTYQGCLSWRALILNLVCYSLVRSTMSQYNIESLIKMEFKYFRIVCG